MEVRVLEAEVKRLRAEREARDAAERELIAELQRRCDRYAWGTALDYIPWLLQFVNNVGVVLQDH